MPCKKVVFLTDTARHLGSEKQHKEVTVLFVSDNLKEVLLMHDMCIYEKGEFICKTFLTYFDMWEKMEEEKKSLLLLQLGKTQDVWIHHWHLCFFSAGGC